jgi:hypothetical protein
MAFDALKHRNIAQVDRVFERFVSLMTGFAFSVAEAAKIYRMLERRQLYRSSRVR